MIKTVANLSTAHSRSTDSDVPVTSQRGRLQRKCACGRMAGPKGECDECRKNRPQREAQNSEVGHPTAHGFMESRSGHDFGKVRVHSDLGAAEPTREINAPTYSEGRRGAVETGRFAHGAMPETPTPDTQGTSAKDPDAPTPKTQPTPMANPPAPTGDTGAVPMDNPSTQGPAIAVTNGWADPSGKTDRTTVGIGELSSFVVKDFEGGSWKSDDGKGTTVNSVTFRWTASAAGKNKITYTASDGGISSVTMTTEVPSTLSGKKDSDLTFPGGTQGAGMELTVTISPKTVSFQALELMEGVCDPSLMTGYFSSHTPKKHDAAAGAGNWRQVGPNNDVSDTADSSGWPSPWSTGSYTWSIPVNWRLKGAQTSTAFSANNNQVVSITGADGTTVVSKLGARTDPRKP